MSFISKESDGFINITAGLENGKGPYKCPECKQLCSSHVGLMRHLASVHPDAYKKCKQGVHTYNSKQSRRCIINWYINLVTDTAASFGYRREKGRYFCTKCETSTKDKPCMLRHARLHKPEHLGQSMLTTFTLFLLLQNYTSLNY
jgi:hypothetical protein